MKLFLSLLFFYSSLLQAQLTVVAVGKAELESAKFVIEEANLPSSFSSTDKEMVFEFLSVLKNDFSFYRKKVNVLDFEKANGYSGVNYGELKKRGLAFYTEVDISKSTFINYEISTYDISQKKKIVSEKGTLPPGKVREVAHQVADIIYQSIFKKRSIFNSKIIFVSDRTTRNEKEPIKELYMMDFDGFNKKQLTFHGGTVISPAISKDRSRILYSLIENVGRKRQRNINLRMLDLETGKDHLISKRKGINSGAVFMPNDENKIVLTLSHIGNAELYIMDLRDRRLQRLTKHHSPDVDPSISVDGTRMTFLSGRPGAAMIYTALTSGVEKAVKRISYVGQYNATPRFSPDGREIAFSSWLDNRFDIFRIDADGSNLSRLTKDFGSNEDPSYSNDGQFIAFSSQRVLSQRKAVQNIYIMDRDGEIIGLVTKDFGNCITPRWSK